MDKHLKKSDQGKRLHRKNESSSFKVVPIFKKPVDIRKLGNALLLLAAKMAQENTTTGNDIAQDADKIDIDKQGLGGSNEKDV